MPGARKNTAPIAVDTPRSNPEQSSSATSPLRSGRRLVRGPRSPAAWRRGHRAHHFQPDGRAGGDERRARQEPRSSWSLAVNDVGALGDRYDVNP